MSKVRWTVAKEGWNVRLMVVGCLLLAGTVGCGSPASDKPASAELRAGNGKPDRPGASQPPAGKARQTDPAPAIVVGSAGATPSPTAIPRDDGDRLNISDTVAKDLGSSDARDRYRALDYWEKKDSKAPIDPIYDAMEDDDPSVRAKAAAILQQYMEKGEERE
jgi:HEAT repeat protein